MTFLQSLGLSKQPPRTNANVPQKPNSTQRSQHSKTTNSSNSSTEVNDQNVDMIQAWANGGSVSLPNKARIAPKNAGQKLDFLS
jgi:hypothetical protein